jgi:hypothetical protein
MKKAEYELKDAEKNKVKQSLDNNGNGRFTASTDLGGLVTGTAQWKG